MRGMIITSMLLATTIALSGQDTYTTNTRKPIPKLRTVDLRKQTSTESFVQYLKYPNPGGEAYHEFLQNQKEKSTLLFPKKETGFLDVRSVVDPPELLGNFSGNSYTAGIPLDNHLAANREDQIVSVVNTHMVVLGPTGIWQEAYSLDDFWSEFGETNFYFDPRVMYDPLEDRFIIAMMQEADCDGSNIVFAFSATNDPTGAWHLYQFSGCPNADATFADFPMIALTQDELFFTYNAVYQDSTWQSGFNQTYIYQINKFDGYAGEDLQWRSWSDITHHNRKLRYICPVKYATEDMGSECYFLSDRSFDIQNDSFFLVHINGNMDAPDLELTVEMLLSDQAYGVPPNAEQPMDFLQTNDARVLDAFYYENQIQFVASTMDFATGRSGVYHGVISDVSFAPVLNGNILGNGSEHFAYPGIAHVGTLPGEYDAIITASHASTTRYPGYSALYFNEGYSEWIAVKEGSRNIDMLKVNNPFGLDPTLERWGDYCGIQRQYNAEGTIWTSASYGKPGSVNDTWIGHLRKPGEATSVSRVQADPDALITFPNPASTWITCDVNVNAQGKLFEAALYDLNGRYIRTVFSKKVSDPGPLRFHYNTSGLDAGTYVIKVTLDGVIWVSETVVVQ